MPLAVGQGTLPDWISVLLAVLTAAAGGWAHLVNRKNRELRADLESRDLELRNALQEIEIQRANAGLERERALGFDQLSDQARQVVVTVGPDRSARGERQYLVNNGSDQAIYDLEIKLISNGRQQYKNLIPVLRAGATYAPSTPHPGVFSCDLKFRDFRSNWWHLDGHSTLRQLPPGYFPRVSAAPPGTFDDDP